MFILLQLFAPIFVSSIQEDLEHLLSLLFHCARRCWHDPVTARTQLQPLDRYQSTLSLGTRPSKFLPKYFMDMARWRMKGHSAAEIKRFAESTSMPYRPPRLTFIVWDNDCIAAILWSIESSSRRLVSFILITSCRSARTRSLLLADNIWTRNGFPFKRKLLRLFISSIF